MKLLLLFLTSITALTCKAESNVVPMITHDSALYEICSEIVTDFTIENATLTDCIFELSKTLRAQGSKFQILLLEGFDEEIQASFNLKSESLDRIIKIISLYYHVDYMIPEHSKYIVIRPSERFFGCCTVFTSYTVPSSHIVNTNSGCIMGTSVGRTIDDIKIPNAHTFVYNIDHEKLSVSTCTTSQRQIRDWLKATVPNFDILNPKQEPKYPKPTPRIYDPDATGLDKVFQELDKAQTLKE